MMQYCIQLYKEPIYTFELIDQIYYQKFAREIGVPCTYILLFQGRETIFLLFIFWRKKDIYNVDLKTSIVEIRAEFFWLTTLSGFHFNVVCFVLYSVCISLDVCSIFSLTRTISYLLLALLARYHSRVLIGSNIPTNYVWLTCLLFYYRSANHESDF